MNIQHYIDQYIYICIPSDAVVSQRRAVPLAARRGRLGVFAGFASHARLPLAVSLPLAVRLRSRLDGGGQRPERALGVAVEELPFVE